MLLVREVAGVRLQNPLTLPLIHASKPFSAAHLSKLALCHLLTCTLMALG